MNSIKDVFSSVLKEITPNAEEINITKNIINKLKELLSYTAGKRIIHYTNNYVTYFLVLRRII